MLEGRYARAILPLASRPGRSFTAKGLEFTLYQSQTDTDFKGNCMVSRFAHHQSAAIESPAVLAGLLRKSAEAGWAEDKNEFCYVWRAS